MFKFLKDKLKGAISKLSKQVDEVGTPVADDSSPAEVPAEFVEIQTSQGPQKSKGRAPKTAAKVKANESIVKVAEPSTQPADAARTNVVKKPVRSKAEREGSGAPAVQEEVHEGARAKDAAQPAAVVGEKKGFFSRITSKITTKEIDASQFEEMFWDLELLLLENNVAVQVIEKIKDDLKRDLVGQPIARSKIEETIVGALKDSVKGLFVLPAVDVIALAGKKSPLVICFIGINGSGKTTTIAKMAKLFQDNGKSVVMAAADTFRAAAIDQLQFHADALGVKLIKHDYGADPAAVAFDAIAHAKAKNRDIVLIDTAGRLHSNANLVDEMKKIVRVAKPDLKIFVGESITGNDCIEQALKFDEAVGLDGIILSKADIDEKGGTAVSVSYVTGKPILYLGTGQEYVDLEPFDPDAVVEQLFA